MFGSSNCSNSSNNSSNMFGSSNCSNSSNNSSNMSQLSDCANSQSPMQQPQMGNMVLGDGSRTDTMESFNNKLKRFQAEGKLPDLNKEAEYTIYRWKAGFASHESIVLEGLGKLFTIEIRVMGSSMNFYTTECVNKKALERCGKVTATGLKLITKAFEVYKNMKCYNFAFNNCQDFVNKYLIAIEMFDQVRVTDPVWIYVTSVLTTWGLGVLGPVGGFGMAAISVCSFMKMKRK